MLCILEKVFKTMTVQGVSKSELHIRIKAALIVQK